MILLRILLFPFSVLYNIIAGLRNRLYDQGIRPSVKFDIPVINVGNLTVGGTGKTPMIEHLIRLLQPNHKVATLSRGYGRQTRGFRIATAADTPATLGDEPYQLFRKFGDSVTVAVGEDRAFAIPNILQERQDTAIILLDDAYQHRRVVPSLNILLSDYYRPFYEDHLLPAGRLRESRFGAERADVIVVTKCPMEISDDEMIAIETAIRRYAEKPVFFTQIHYSYPVSFGRNQRAFSNDVILVTGIGNAGPLKMYVHQNFKLVEHLEFDDHHDYSVRDLEQLQRLMKLHPGVSFITTEKDMVKINRDEFLPVIQDMPLFYLSIEIDFVKSGEDFDEIILNAVRSNG